MADPPGMPFDKPKEALAAISDATAALDRKSVV